MTVAVTAGISIGIEVDRNAKQVIGNLPASNGVRFSQTSHVLGVVGILRLVAALLNSLLNALECRNDTTIEPNRVSKERSLHGHGCRGCVPRERSLWYRAVSLNPVSNGFQVRSAVKDTVLDV